MVEFAGDEGEEFDSLVERFRRRVSSIEGVANVVVHRIDSNQATVDFNIGFPFNPLVEKPNRIGAVAKTSLTIADEPNLTDGAIVAMATIRLAPLPADIWTAGDAAKLVNDTFPDEIGEVDTTVHIEPGEVSGKTEEWWPHIDFAGLHDGPNVEQFTRVLETSIPEYLSTARERNR